MERALGPCIKTIITITKGVHSTVNCLKTAWIMDDDDDGWYAKYFNGKRVKSSHDRKNEADGGSRELARSELKADDVTRVGRCWLA